MDVEKLKISGEIGHQISLAHIEYTFDPAAMYALAGRNGTGKSTLLLTLAGEIEPFAGEVTLGEKPPGDITNAGKIVRVSDPVFLPDLSLGSISRCCNGKPKLISASSLDPGSWMNPCRSHRSNCPVASGNARFLPPSCICQCKCC